MTRLKDLKGNKVHNRNINISTYEYNEESIIVEGELKDNRLINCYSVFGEYKEPTVIHHMIIRILVEPGFYIKEIEVEMLETPREPCIETINSLDWLKGERIAEGFTMKVKERVGGGYGCQHLSTLIMSMASAAIQGFVTFNSKNRISSERADLMIDKFLTDTCHTWRKDGELLKKLAESAKERE